MGSDLTALGGLGGWGGMLTSSKYPVLTQAGGCSSLRSWSIGHKLIRLEILEFSLWIRQKRIARRLCCAVLAGNTGLLQHSFRGCCRRAVGLSASPLSIEQGQHSGLWIFWIRNNSNILLLLLTLLGLSGVAVLEFHITVPSCALAASSLTMPWPGMLG